MATREARRAARQARDERQRGRILAAAEELFAQGGYDETKIQDVAAEAGVSLGTLYKCFPGKWEIFGALHERRAGDLLAGCQASLVPGAPPLANLERFAAAYFEYLTAHPAYLRMHLHDASAWSFGRGFPSAAQSGAWRRAFECEVELVREGIADGSIVVSDPVLLVRTMAAVHQVQLADWVERGAQEPPQTLLAEMRRTLARLFRP